jgi:hypothetical protein
MLQCGWTPFSNPTFFFHCALVSALSLTIARMIYFLSPLMFLLPWGLYCNILSLYTSTGCHPFITSSFHGYPDSSLFIVLLYKLILQTFNS